MIFLIKTQLLQAACDTSIARETGCGYSNPPLLDTSRCICDDMRQKTDCSYLAAFFARYTCHTARRALKHGMHGAWTRCCLMANELNSGKFYRCGVLNLA